MKVTVTVGNSIGHCEGICREGVKLTGTEGTKIELWVVS